MTKHCKPACKRLGIEGNNVNLRVKTTIVNITDIQNKTVQVDNYQATFLTLKIDDKLFRFDLIDKKEFNLKKGTRGQFTIMKHTHYLLTTMKIL